MVPKGIQTLVTDRGAADTDTPDLGGVLSHVRVAHTAEVFLGAYVYPVLPQSDVCDGRGVSLYDAAGVGRVRLRVLDCPPLNCLVESNSAQATMTIYVAFYSAQQNATLGL